MPRSTVSVAELRGRLSSVLRMAEEGRDVVVTRHGAAIVRLVAVQEESEKLSSAGVRPAERPGSLPKVRPFAGRLERTLARTVLEERA